MDRFIVANSRGKKPVLNDIKNCYLKIQDLRIELNTCAAKFKLDVCANHLFSILENEGYEIGINGRLIKKK